jgi:hypothetical protein
MPNAQYEVPAAWGQAKYHDLTVPSGGVVQVKQIDLQAIVAADLIDEFDKLSGTAEEKVVGPAKGKRPADRPAKKPTKKQYAAARDAAMRDFFKKDNIEALTGLMDRVLPQIVVQPRITSSQIKSEAGKWVTLEQEDREEGVIYVDTIPFADQMAILEFGMSGLDMEGLQSFREQPEPDLANVEHEPKTPDETE